MSIFLAQNLEACLIGGRWYLLDSDYKMKILSLITNVIESNCWPLNRVDKTETLKVLRGVEHPDSIEQIFSLYMYENDPAEKWTLNEAKVSR